MAVSGSSSFSIERRIPEKMMSKKGQIPLTYPEEVNDVQKMNQDSAE